jgi:hypothetical protein
MTSIQKLEIRQKNIKNLYLIVEIEGIKEKIARFKRCILTEAVLATLKGDSK